MLPSLHSWHFRNSFTSILVQILEFRILISLPQQKCYMQKGSDICNHLLKCENQRGSLSAKSIRIMSECGSCEERHPIRHRLNWDFSPSPLSIHASLLSNPTLLYLTANPGSSAFSDLFPHAQVST